MRVSEDVVCFAPPPALVFARVRQNSQVLQEDISCQTCEYCARFYKCVWLSLRFFAIYSRARAIGFVLGLMCWEAIGAYVHCCIPYAMEQLCTQDTGANIVHMGMGGEEVVVM